MNSGTISRLICPACEAPLRWTQRPTSVDEINSGEMGCEGCALRFPVIDGVAIIVRDVEGYLSEFFGAIQSVVPESTSFGSWQDHWDDLNNEFGSGDDLDPSDLESKRVNSLYGLTHFVSGSQLIHSDDPPLLQTLIRDYWDHGPADWVRKNLEGYLSNDPRSGEVAPLVVEIGSGLGGLAKCFWENRFAYLGFDTSFTSIHGARDLFVRRPVEAIKWSFPGDLAIGPLVRDCMIAPRIPTWWSQRSSLPNVAGPDFVVGDVRENPIAKKQADWVVAMNVIDMIDDPRQLPELQAAILKGPGGVAIQSSPYVWHREPARYLSHLEGSNSSDRVRKLYESKNFFIESEELHLPWLFFKHERQLEIYWAHIFRARL